jgi:hypothetical protein
LIGFSKPVPKGCAEHLQIPPSVLPLSCFAFSQLHLLTTICAWHLEYGTRTTKTAITLQMGHTFSRIPSAESLRKSDLVKLRIAEERVRGNGKGGRQKEARGPCWAVIPVNMAAHVTHVTHSQPTTVSIYSRMNIREPS